MKLISHIKKLFSRRKSTLDTFVYVKKAYDSVWHARLHYKLTNVGITGVIYQYFKNFLPEIYICMRVGKSYSSNKKLIWVFHRAQLIHISYLPLLYMLSQKHYITHVAQYADDIAIWVNTTLRTHTDKKVVSHLQKRYQSELNKLTAYIKENGSELSRENMCVIFFFYNGENPKCLPQKELDA